MDALSDLAERDRQVVELRHGLDGKRPHTLAEIGRLLGLSTQRVHQLERRALDQIGARSPIAARRRVSPEGSARLVQGLVRPWVLMLLWNEPSQGYELVERLAEVGLCADNGAIYRLLRRLEHEGHVASNWETSNHGPDRRIYTLTACGVAHLRQDAETLQDLETVVNDFNTRYRSRARGRGKRRRKVSPEAAA